MKRFLLKLALRLALFGLVGMVFVWVLPKRWYLGHEYARWEILFERMSKAGADAAPNLILGDSRPEMGLTATKLRAENFGLGGTSPVEGYYFLREMADRRIDTLYLSYAPFHLQSMDCFYTRSDYYDFVEEDFIAEVVEKAEEMKDSTFLRHNWAWLDVLERDFPWRPTRELVKYVPSIRNMKNWRWHFDEGTDFEGQLKKDQFSFLVGAEECPRDSAAPEMALEEEFGKFQASPVNDHYLQRLVELAKERKIQLVWVNMPLSQTTMQPGWKYFGDFEAYLKTRLPKGTPIVPFTTYDHCEFRDFNHLDRDGAAKFTRAMKALLKFLK